MIAYLLAVGALLFGCGLIGVLFRRNLLVILMSIELMLAGVGLSAAVFSRAWGNHDGQILTFFMIIAAAVEAGIGFGLILTLFRRRETLNSNRSADLRW